MLQLKILHAARKIEDPTCHNQDPAGPSKNIHKYLKSTTEVVITAQCIECLLSKTSLKALPIDIPYIVKSCCIHPKIQCYNGFQFTEEETEAQHANLQPILSPHFVRNLMSHSTA